MTRFFSSAARRGAIIAAAMATAAILPAPAYAGGGHYDRHNYRPYYRHYDYGRYDGYRHRGYDRRGRSHLSGGEAALIAAGIIGGVILIDRALDNRDQRNRYDDRYRDDDRYRRGAFDDDNYYERDERDYGRYDDRDSYSDYDDGYGRAVEEQRGDLDDSLLGGDEIRERPQFAEAAFRECVAETRGAAGAGGMNVAMPGAPTDVEELADGSVRMSAQFRASNARGDGWTRRFVCEADESGVRFLQID